MVLAAKIKVRDEQDVFDELAALCASPGYAEVIARFCLRDNLVVISQAGMTGKALAKTFSQERLIRTEISTLIGLMIRQPVEFTPQLDATLDEYSARTEALLRELHDTMGIRWDLILPNILEDPNFNPFKGAHALREPIFYGAESAYHFQYRELAVPKYLADNAWLQHHRGFSITTARDVVRAVQRVLEEKARNFIDAARARQPLPALSAYTFSVQDVARAARLDEKVVEPVLSAFTLDPTDRNTTFATLSDFNVSNALPLMRTADGKFILFQLYSLTEALYDSPFFWMLADKHYRPTAAAHRGAYTEAFAAERLSRVFGRGRVFANVIIPGAKGETRGEIDTLVLFGDRAIVVQAKAKRLTLEARKGNDLQLQADFKGAVQDACDQAMDCAALLLDPGVKLVDDKGQEIDLKAQIARVFPICLVSDHYPALAFQARQFLTFPTVDKIAPPFVMDVFALDAITEMLTSPLRLISYLELRAKAGDAFMASGELTILGYHLGQNLWVIDDANLIVLHDDVAANLDAAMIVRREGMPGPRVPEGILTRFRGTSVARLIDAIDAEPTSSVLELGLFLLELAEDSVHLISDAMDSVCAAARRDHRGHDATFPIANAGLTLHANALPEAEAVKQLENHCRQRKYAQKAERWFGMSLDVATGRPRFGLMMAEPWAADPDMDELVADLPQPEVVRAARMPKLVTNKPGRNEPCPCGSGRKFKKCCIG